MIFIVIFAIAVCIILFCVVVFLFFNREKSKHQIVLQNIQETIDEQQNIFINQKYQLQNLEKSAKFSEHSMRKVVDALQEIPPADNEFVEQYLQNLGVFSENSLDLIKIYGRFVKVLS